MKQKLSGIFGTFGAILWYLLTIAFAIMPLVALDLPWWAFALITFAYYLLSDIFPIISTTAYIVLWIIGAVDALKMPVCFWSVVYLICFVIYIVYVILTIVFSLKSRN